MGVKNVGKCVGKTYVKPIWKKVCGENVCKNHAGKMCGKKHLWKPCVKNVWGEMCVINMCGKLVKTMWRKCAGKRVRNVDEPLKWNSSLLHIFIDVTMVWVLFIVIQVRSTLEQNAFQTLSKWHEQWMNCKTRSSSLPFAVNPARAWSRFINSMDKTKAAIPDELGSNFLVKESVSVGFSALRWLVLGTCCCLFKCRLSFYTSSEIYKVEYS